MLRKWPTPSHEYGLRKIIEKWLEGTTKFDGKGKHQIHHREKDRNP